MKRQVLLGCGVLLAALVCVAGGLLAWGLRQERVLAATPGPTITLLAPPDNSRFALGDTVTLELEIEAGPGRALQSVVVRAGSPVIHRSTPEGQNRLLLAVPYTPLRPGPVTLLVVVYDDAGARAVREILLHVEAPEPDLDRDGVPDAVDRCPERSGSLDEAGCPATTVRDTDGDTVPDPVDWCPEHPGPVENAGCPRPAGGEAGDGEPEAGAEPETRDRDGDGVPDVRDLCPDTPGRADLAEGTGCPDSDGDGVVDAMDRCPDTPGSSSEGAPSPGCPLTEEETSEDRDGDGLPDAEDACPGEPGLGGVYRGCPVTLFGPDRDGDGIPDIWDMCPDEPGERSLFPFRLGCPERTAPPPECPAADHPDAPWDTDGDGEPDACDRDDDQDGRYDEEDLCPFIPGVGAAGTSGCHPWLPGEADADGDGVANRADRCPLHPGSSESRYRGCPEGFDTRSDADGDGIPDRIDLCPDATGTREYLGCGPDGDDPDGDGIPWREDACPEVHGRGMASGCPPTLPADTLLGGMLDGLGGRRLFPGVDFPWQPGLLPFEEEGEPRLVVEVTDVETERPFDRVVCYGEWEGQRGVLVRTEAFRIEGVAPGTSWSLPEDERPFVAYSGPFPEEASLWLTVSCMGIEGLWLSTHLGGGTALVFDQDTSRAYEEGLFRPNDWRYLTLDLANARVGYRLCYGDRCPRSPEDTAPIPPELPDTFFVRLDLVRVRILNDGDPWGRGELRKIWGTLINERMRTELEARGERCLIAIDGDFTDPVYDPVRCGTRIVWLFDRSINDGDVFDLDYEALAPYNAPVRFRQDDALTLIIGGEEADGRLEIGRSEWSYYQVTLSPEEWLNLLEEPQTVVTEAILGDDFAFEVTFVLRRVTR